VPAVPYCVRYKCTVHVDCGDNDGDKDDLHCRQHPPYVGVVPEPRTWAMLGVGVAVVGGVLRRRRGAARALV
jgi:hypothetical protein